MVLNILGSLVPLRITGNANAIGILINPHIIKAHDRRHVLLNRVINGRKTLPHPQIHDDRHRFHWDRPVSYIPIWPDSSAVNLPCFVLADEPGYVSLGAGIIFKGIELVLFAVVPVVVKAGEAGHGLLVGTAAVVVYVCYLVVINFGEVWFWVSLLNLD